LQLSGFADWLVDRGLRGLSLTDQVDGFCRRLVDAGFPARRFNMSIGTLHPTHGARSYVWRPDGIATEQHARRRNDEQRQAFLRSPVHYVIMTGERGLRRRLDGDAPLDFPVLEDLRALGMTEYAARVVDFNDASTLGARIVPADEPASLSGVYFSCATDDPHGFDDVHLEQAAALLPYLALAVKARSTFDVAQTLLQTYLGMDAGARVLTGEIDRHSVRSIDAVIWLCDLRGFSRMANRISHDELIEVLDEYLEMMARPVIDNRGQILKFMGDGFLATFDLASASAGDVCANALDAAEHVVRALPAFNQARRDRDHHALDVGVALHLGEVLYGNIGTPERLDFTVVGSAVNEASRMEGLCRPLGRNVLVSRSVFNAAGVGQRKLLSLGFHALRGISEPQELFTIA
jgi:adenylate cyclase